MTTNLSLSKIFDTLVNAKMAYCFANTAKSIVVHSVLNSAIGTYISKMTTASFVTPTNN